MKGLKITENLVEFTHKTGSRYVFEDYDDNGLTVNYLEIDKDGFGHYHKVLLEDVKDWNSLCKTYPLF